MTPARDPRTVGAMKLVRKARAYYLNLALFNGQLRQPSNPGADHRNAHLFPEAKRARRAWWRPAPTADGRTVREKIAALGERLRRGDA